MQTRQPWDDVPATLRTLVATSLGAAPVQARSQSGGFSPGSADRLTLADGTRAFVKTLERAVNPYGYDLHLRESRVLRALPPTVPAPALLDVIEADGWIALVVEDVDGRVPSASAADTSAVLDVLHALPAAASLDIEVPSLADEMRGAESAWERIEPVTDWQRGHLHRLRASASHLLDVIDGERLVHLDVRADNTVVSADGPVLVDWPWASRGVAWFDALGYLVDVRLRDASADVQRHLTHPVFASLTSDVADVVLSALAGSFLENSRTPAPQGMPGLRAFQRAESDACLALLADRWG